MNYEFLFGTTMQLGFAFTAFLLVMAVLGLILNRNTSWQAVAFIGLCLIAIAAGALAYIEAMKGVVLKLHVAGEISDWFLAEFQARSNLFLFVFPFVTAAIGTNLISDVITKRLNHERSIGACDLANGAWDFIKLIVGVVLLPPVIVVVVICLIFSNLRKHIPTLVRVVGLINRKAENWLLKHAIIFRNTPIDEVLRRKGEPRNAGEAPVSENTP